MKKEQTERHKYWRGVIVEQKASGKSIRDFCRERNLGEHSFYWWRRVLREEKPVAFALVETKPAAPAAKFELALGSGEVLRVPADVESLRVLLEALRAR
jgi:putative transposase